MISKNLRQKGLADHPQCYATQHTTSSNDPFPAVSDYETATRPLCCQRRYLNKHVNITTGE